MGGFQSQEITRCHSLTFGTAQRGGHPFVHDEQRAIQPRALHGHLDLFDAWVQGSLPGLFSGEDSVALAVDLCRGWTDSSCSSCKSWRWKMDGWMDWSRAILSQVYFVIKFLVSYRAALLRCNFACKNTVALDLFEEFCEVTCDVMMKIGVIQV